MSKFIIYKLDFPQVFTLYLFIEIETKGLTLPNNPIYNN